MNITNIIVKIIDKFENDRNLIEEFTAVGAPKLIYNGADDKYQSIMASEFQFNLMVNDKTDGKFFHLYTGNEKRYLVTVEDQDNNLLFEGFLLPDFYSEPYDNGVIFVDLTATDGLGLLKGQYLPNIYYKQESSVIKLIAECLLFTQLDKNIVFAPAIESAATDYRWDEIAVNGATYLDGEIETVLLVGEVMPKRKNAYEILDLLLESLGCTLYGQGNTWYIEGINRKHEESQFIYNYDKNGVFQNTETVTKNVVDLTFFKTPTISIVSPWKAVDVEWNIDEDGDLIPAKELEGVPDGNILFPSYNAPDFWKTNGAVQLNVISDKLRLRYQNLGLLGVLSGSEAPVHIRVGGMLPSLNQDLSYYYTYSLSEVPNHFIDIKNKKYLKISDEYIDRKIEFKMNVLSQVRRDDDSPFTLATDGVEESELSYSYKYQMLVKNNIILSTLLPNSDIKNVRLTCKKSQETSDIQQPLLYGDYYINKPYSVDSSIEQKDLQFTENGFFNLKLHPPVSPNPLLPWYESYVVQSLSVKITELKTWQDSFTRNIDFSTTKSVDIFHGDSIADLTEKNFRFRRPVYNTEEAYGQVSILSYENLFPLQPWFYHYFITYEAFVAINSNPELFTVVFGGNEILMNDLNSGMEQIWSLTGTFSGAYFLQINSQLINHPSGIGANITDFLNLYVGESDPYIIGYETEDNEWRESWKRFGQTESIRYGVAIGKMYHDVQPEALVKVEGSVIGCFFPREIGRFLWRDVKKFIPTRTTIDFTKGRSEVLILENLHEIVTDYVD